MENGASEFGVPAPPAGGQAMTGRKGMESDI
jgi:hypothetical protein